MTESQSGGCYCGALRYEVTEAPQFKAQCHCRACSHVSGGGPNYFMLVPENGFAWTTGAPATFTKPDLENAVTREFCGTCGTHIVTRRPGLPAVIVKAGSLDDPNVFKGPKAAIYMAQALEFHQVPDDIARFDDLPTG